MPFRLLRNIGVLYVPASIEARRKTVHPPIIPTPGSYPVQAYAPVSSTSNLQATETTPKTFEGWAHSYYTQGSPVQVSGYYGHNHGYGLKHSFGPSYGHGHKHGHSCSHSQGHGHSHEHSFGHGLSHGHASASQTSSHWALVAQHPHSQHSHLSPLSVSVSAPQSFTANMPESLPESVTVHPGAPVSSLTDWWLQSVTPKLAIARLKFKGNVLEDWKWPLHFKRAIFSNHNPCKNVNSWYK